ncbi:hypothetical protein FSARC_9104 [Fusarium sarcochroum]|uniref:Uncharacterized protein n=1 Tax=Fusarium sarcochroum TaxID=1208366 RepID=A0A8H4X6I6_9HYPO|nr:hypothetical protein FSARC_9104 [Fusarium sarcochroum]
MPHPGEVDRHVAAASEDRARSIFGINWATYKPELQRLIPETLDSKLCISLNKQDFEAQLFKLTQAIMDDWGALRIRKDSDRFGTAWSRLSGSARRKMLQDCDSKLSNLPHSAVYAWAEGVQARGNFTNSACWLNVYELSKDDVLPRLLEVRAKEHPRVFRYVDSRLVQFRICNGDLRPLKVVGILSHEPYTERDEGSSYGCSLIRCERDGPQISTGPYEESPSLGYYRIREQQFVYRFLIKCLRSTLEIDDRGLANKPQSGECSLSMLEEASRLDICTSPRAIDIGLLDSVVQSNLEDATNTLWQIRDSPSELFRLMKSTPSRQAGSMETMLRDLCGRIDRFHTLNRHLVDLRPESLRGSEQMNSLELASLHDEQLRRYAIILHNAFSSVLEELLDHSSEFEGLKDGTIVFGKMWNLIKTNDPRIRLIGPHVIMRMIEREITQHDMQDLIPPSMSIILSDLSVLAVCLRQTEKYLPFIPRDTEHDTLLTKLRQEWAIQERPWKGFVETTLGRLNESGKAAKLKVYVLDDNVGEAERFSVFWRTIDEYMRQAAVEDEDRAPDIAYILQNSLPGDITSKTASTTSTENRTAELTPYQSTSPSQTKLRKSRGAAPPTSSTERTSSVSGTLIGSQRPPRLIIKSSPRAREIIRSIFSTSQDHDAEFSWVTMVRMMEGLGFAAKVQGGAGYRFYHRAVGGAIVFHRPHNYDYTREAAQKMVERIKRCVPNDTELRELLTSPSGTISHVISAASSYLDITASRAFDILGSAPSFRLSRTTDICSLGCPDNIRSILLLDIEGQRTLTSFSSAASRCLQSTLAASAAEQDQQPSAARLSGPSVAPDLDARASNGSLPFSFSQLKRCMTDLCSRVLPSRRACTR